MAVNENGVRLQQWRLIGNGLDLCMSKPHPVYGYRIRASADGTDWGNPEAVISALASQLVDGDLENVDRYGNRQATIRLLIDAPGHELPGAAVARGQAAVEAAFGFDGWAPLEWTSMLKGAETTVMEMTSAQVGKQFSDIKERNQGARVLALTIGARPFVRPLEPEQIVAPPVPPGGVTPPEDIVIIDAAAASSITDLPVRAIDVQPGYPYDKVNVVELEGGVAWARTLWDGRGEAVWSIPPYAYIEVTEPIVFDADHPILRARVRTQWTNGASWLNTPAPTIYVYASNTPVATTVLSRTQISADTWEISLTPKTEGAEGPITGYGFRASWPESLRQSLWQARVGIEDARLVATLQEGVFTGHVQTRTIEVDGSQRTEASFQVIGLGGEGPSEEALGPQTAIYTASAGDDGRAKFVACRLAAGDSGPVGTGDSGATSGVYNVLSSTATVFSFGANMMLPGEKQILASLRPTTVGTKTIHLDSVVTTGGVSTTDSLDATVTVGATWPAVPEDEFRLVPLGHLQVPAADVLDQAATVDIKASSSSGGLHLDDLFLFDVVTGQLTLVDTSGGISAVQVSAASVDHPNPRVLVGRVDPADESLSLVAAGGRLQAMDQHVAEPGLMQVVTITPGTSNSRLSGTYFRHNGHDVAPRGAFR